MHTHSDVEFKDLADSPLASYSHHPMEDLEPREEDLIPKSRAHEAIRNILAHLAEHKNAGFEAKCMAVAIGVRFSITQDAMTEIATRYNYTKQNVSKRVKEIQKEFGFPVNLSNKRHASSDAYRLSNKRQTKIGDWFADVKI